ncbi:H-NS family nucleoid-associated regulatory protein [Aliiglaciecola sp. M165]|uniref:H-NS histone family protein n=1 Tax=Aliiglaciecola sp. M165 TaxID=2593649 RepID=UPI001180ABDD|nr:H-NS family nucleoid-associated regulatory protein [Aliiglaciecola sp. M165]TRY30257.1 H-NS histone family protein [Aliiglaciecola sp. M165]
MENFLNVLCHGRKLQSATKSLSDEQLLNVIAKLENIINKRVEKRLAEQKAEQEKRLKIQQIYQQMEEAGLDISDFQSPDSQHMSPKNRQKRRVKYLYLDNAGEQIKWSGVGKMPRVFADAIARGHDIDDFRVDQHDTQ